MSQELVIDAEVLTGPQDLQAAKEAQKNLNNFIASQMRDGVDYGIIPGTKKKSLWQPGAQKLLFFNGLGCRIEAQLGTVTDFKGGFFNYEYKAVVFHKSSGKVVSECVGSANSLETRYRYIWLTEKKLPKGINKDDLEAEERSSANGSFKVYRLANPEPQSQANTLQKMAQKRAMIGAALLACRASENFTQDLEEEEVKEHRPAPKAAEEPAEANGLVISDAQRKRLFAIQNAAKVPSDVMVGWIGEHYPYTIKDGDVSSSLILRKDYDTIIKWLESQKP